MEEVATPTGLPLCGIEYGNQSPLLFEKLTQPPLGLPLLEPFSQGSRATRQPWANLHNRFAVQLTNFALEQTVLWSETLTRLITD
jgi:hypothetical protein